MKVVISSIGVASANNLVSMRGNIGVESQREDLKSLTNAQNFADSAMFAGSGTHL